MTGDGRSVPVGDVSLWVEVHGELADEVVLLLSGSDATTRRWPATLIDELVAAGLGVVAFDTRDCGLSSRIDPDTPYRLEDLALDACGVLDALGIAAAHVVGYSMGGAVAQLLALEHRARVRTLVLVSSTPGLGDERLPPADDDYVAFVVDRLFGDPPRSDEQKIEWIVEGYRRLAGTRFAFDEDAQRVLAQDELDRGWSAESGHGVAATASRSRLDRLRDIAVPTVVVHGDADPVFPLPHGEALAEGIPGARLVVVEGLGHELPVPLGGAVAAEVLGLRR